MHQYGINLSGIGYWPIFSHIVFRCIVADIANSEFRIHTFNSLSCAGNFPLSLLQFENVPDNIAHSGSLTKTLNQDSDV